MAERFGAGGVCGGIAFAQHPAIQKATGVMRFMKTRNIGGRVGNLPHRALAVFLTAGLALAQLGGLPPQSGSTPPVQLPPVLLKGSGIDTLWPNVLVLVAFAVVLLSLSIRRFRKQLG
jgi:hypothetical protein